MEPSSKESSYGDITVRQSARSFRNRKEELQSLLGNTVKESAKLDESMDTVFDSGVTIKLQ